jgi:hypothetical protein
LALCKVQILIAPTCLKILKEPEFIGFWSSERTAYADRKLIVGCMTRKFPFRSLLQKESGRPRPDQETVRGAAAALEFASQMTGYQELAYDAAA